MDPLSNQDETTSATTDEPTREFDTGVLKVVSDLESRFRLLDRNHPVLAEVVTVCMERKLAGGDSGRS